MTLFLFHSNFLPFINLGHMSLVIPGYKLPYPLPTLPLLLFINLFLYYFLRLKSPLESNHRPVKYRHAVLIRGGDLSAARVDSRLSILELLEFMVLNDLGLLSHKENHSGIVLLLACGK